MQTSRGCGQAAGLLFSHQARSELPTIAAALAGCIDYRRLVCQLACRELIDRLRTG